MAATEDESDEDVECLAPECDQSFGSEHGMKSHLGMTHEIEGLMLDELQELTDELGRTPTLDEMGEVGRFSHYTYRAHFGSWNDALEAAELEKNSENNIGEERLLGAIQNLADELGRAPTSREMKEVGRFSSSVFLRTFGSWNDALEAAGLEKNREMNIGEERLLGALQNLADELGRTPTRDEMEGVGRFSDYTYRAHFGGWNDALEAAGFEPWTQPTGPDHWAWDGGYQRVPYGSGWTAVRSQVLERDNHECQIDGCTLGEDRRIHAHHIVPRRAFYKRDIPVGDSNVPRNLIALCSKHHPKVDHGLIDCPYPPEHPRSEEYPPDDVELEQTQLPQTAD